MGKTFLTINTEKLNFEEEVLQTSEEIPVFVYFYKGKGTSSLNSFSNEKLYQEFQKQLIQKRLEDMPLVLADITLNRGLAKQYDVTEFPTIAVFKEGIKRGYFADPDYPENVQLWLESKGLEDMLGPYKNEHKKRAASSR